jgi:hypothetical protein
VWGFGVTVTVWQSSIEEERHFVISHISVLYKNVQPSIHYEGAILREGLWFETELCRRPENKE